LANSTWLSNSIKTCIIYQRGPQKLQHNPTLVDFPLKEKESIPSKCGNKTFATKLFKMISNIHCRTNWNVHWQNSSIEVCLRPSYWRSTCLFKFKLEFYYKVYNTKVVLPFFFYHTITNFFFSVKLTKSKSCFGFKLNKLDGIHLDVKFNEQTRNIN
jgi:hypothetical protein